MIVGLVRTTGDRVTNFESCTHVEYHVYTIEIY